MASLQTQRLDLRPFAKSDLDEMSALMANTDFMRFSLAVSRVISLTHPDNIASRRVAEKNGMRPEKQTIFRGFPTIVFGINREERNGS